MIISFRLFFSLLENKYLNLEERNAWGRNRPAEMTTLIALWIFEFSSFLIGFVLHCFGIYAVSGFLKVSNQAIILCKISVLQVASVFIGITTDVLHLNAFIHDRHENTRFLTEFVRDSYPKDLVNVYEFLFMTLTGDLVLTMLLLVFDRFFSLMYPIRYRLYMEISTVTNITIATIIFSICISASIAFSNNIKYVFFYQCFALFILLGTLSFITYVCIAITYKRLERKNPVVHQNKLTRVNLNNNFVLGRHRMIQCLIAVTYIMSFFIPARLIFLYVKYMLQPTMPVTVFETLKCVYVVGFILDPMIFIFLSKRIRKMLKSQISDLLKGRQRDPTTELVTWNIPPWDAMQVDQPVYYDTTEL